MDIPCFFIFLSLLEGYWEQSMVMFMVYHPCFKSPYLLRELPGLWSLKMDIVCLKKVRASLSTFGPQEDSTGSHRQEKLCPAGRWYCSGFDLVLSEPRQQIPIACALASLRNFVALRTDWHTSPLEAYKSPKLCEQKLRWHYPTTECS